MDNYIITIARSFGSGGKEILPPCFPKSWVFRGMKDRF